MAEVLAVPPVLNQYQKYVKPKLINEEYRKKRNDCIKTIMMNKRMNNPEFYEKELAYANNRYNNDPEFREKRKAQMREYQKKRYQEMKNALKE